MTLPNPFVMTKEELKSKVGVNKINYSLSYVDEIPKVGDRFIWEFDGEKKKAEIVKINSFKDGKSFLVMLNETYALPGTKSAKGKKIPYTINELLKLGYKVN